MKNRRMDFECEDMGNGIFRINEFDFVNSFLVVGEEKAALLDCGAGVGQMRAFVETLTDKPITVLITHSHADHDGGAVWFPEIYVHPNEFRRCKMDMQAWARIYFLHQHEYKRKTHNVPYSAGFQREYKPILHALNEGDCFDLGGRVIETYLTPGHTTGHVAFRDTKTGALFAGDNVNPLVTLQFPGGCSVDVWKEAAERTLALANGAPIYGGHGKGIIPAEAIECTIALAEEILKKPNAKSKKPARLSAGEKQPCVVYRTDRIHKL